MKHLFIVNPVAGGMDHSAEVKEKAEKAFSGRSDAYEIYITRGPMDAVEKIKSEAASGEALRVYGCGGDGTFNECVCGAAGLENVAVAPFPTGTGNDFCRMFGEEAELFRDIDAILDGEEHEIDLIDCNGRYSVNICSVGFDAKVGVDVHKYSNRFIKGMLAYGVSLVANIVHGMARNMRISCGDFRAEGMHTLACACNGRYYGGGFNPSCDAMPDDGILDFFIIDKISLLEFALLIGKYASGKADEIKTHITHIRGTEIEIDFDEDCVVQVDGEAMFTKHIKMTICPKATRLVVPRGMKFFD